ncbi:MAG: radical SAM protein, partial [Actinobacteria bacterium]|nr:radical SAM protein [Actinomycetota bacterium]
MRWHTTDDELALFGLDDLVGPERSTGRMSDLQFLHVVAKRILNHTPAPSRAPSSWTINVYRGCSHACVYCLGGDTLVLTSDGRTRRIADLRPGDAVYGTIGSGASRRYVPTLVHDHWSTLRRAYRVTLADGTELIASGDHRFLTDLGWKHVVAASASDQRPHLTADNRLLGFGQLPPTAPAGEDYRRGYLTGSIRGDAHVGSYRYPRSGRTPGEVHRFRLALADLEPLDRTASYLAAAGITTDRFQFTPASETRREMTAIRTQRSDDVAAIRQLIVWPIRPSAEWQRGFLAGIFDAEGSHSCGVLRISTANREIVDHVLDASRALGFDVVLEPAQPNGVRTIRLLGGLREGLR